MAAWGWLNHIVRYPAYGLVYALHDHSHICVESHSNLLQENQEMGLNQASEAFLGATRAGLFCELGGQCWDW